MNNNTAAQSERSSGLRVTALLGAASLIAGVTWMSLLSLPVMHGGTVQFIDVTFPLAPKLMFVGGAIALVMVANVVSESRWLQTVGATGAIAVVVGFAWLTIWDYMFVQRSGTAYAWQSPGTARWLLLLGCAALVFSGVVAIAVMIPAGVKRFRRKLS